MRRAAAACVVAAVVAPSGVATAASPRVEQLVVYKDGSADQTTVTAAKATARIGARKRCAIGAATPLAALLHSGLPGIALKDYGSCSKKRPADAGSIYVKRIRHDAASGLNGWVYKVGNKVGTTGAGDTSGPFGSGRLQRGARVTWLYCRMKSSGCQRTLAITPKALGGGQVRVTVRAYDDQGKARPAAGASILAGGTRVATADSHGVATFTTAPGTMAVHAEAKGMVRSFGEQVRVQ